MTQLHFLYYNPKENILISCWKSHPQDSYMTMGIKIKTSELSDFQIYEIYSLFETIAIRTEEVVLEGHETILCKK